MRYEGKENLRQCSIATETPLNFTAGAENAEKILKNAARSASAVN